MTGERRSSGDVGSADAGEGAENRFEKRNLSKSSTDMYFKYYGMLNQQQNMLQDYVRTGTYYAAIMNNRDLFEGKVVVDVGAGTGILSLFAVMAGAKVVYAVEASEMAKHARKLCEANKDIGGDRVRVCHCKVEDFKFPDSDTKADILISEPMGTLLVNERMLESYLSARDRLLRRGGLMFPTKGRIYVAPFLDESLHAEVLAKSNLWLNTNFYGVDLSALHGDATRGNFEQVVIDAMSASQVLAKPECHEIDFTTAREESLHKIDIPLCFPCTAPLQVHGLVCWFDVDFPISREIRERDPEEGGEGSPEPLSKAARVSPTSDDSGQGAASGGDGSSSPAGGVLTTSPGAPVTHWYQVRCLLRNSLKALPGQTIKGSLSLAANALQSYDIAAELSVVSQEGYVVGSKTSTGQFDLKNPYYRSYMQFLGGNAQ